MANTAATDPQSFAVLHPSIAAEWDLERNTTAADAAPEASGGRDSETPSA